MSQLVANCPRCKAKEITFNLISEIPTTVRCDWQQYYEAFCICRACNHSTVFVLSQKKHRDRNYLDQNKLSSIKVAVNQYMKVEGHISLKDSDSEKPPEYLPENVEAAFREGSACLAIGCPNAAATMFRLCIDLTTKPMLPEKNDNELNNSIRRNLGLRLPWLFKNNILPEALSDISKCIKDDGNDGAHEGTLDEETAGDILDFTYVLLERIYTEPRKIEIAIERRTARHAKK